MSTAEMIRIKYHDKDLVRAEQKGYGDYIDLRAADDYKLEKDTLVMISLGVSMQLPKGYYAEVVPRSSSFKKWGILMANSVGIIDETYCGDNDIWRFPAWCTHDGEIHKNDRICQFRIVEKQPAIVFKEEETLGNEDRGGFGSTGVK